MTLGGLVQYLAFTAVLAAPVMNIASIGTQISEAFAGLDRIREMMRMRTEDEEDASRQPVAPSAATCASTTSGSSTTPASRC
jgi:ABC-type bacteriocin/lantibiotic exporter with double-glycine peptidase domain